MKESKILVIYWFYSFFGLLAAFPEQGKWDFQLSSEIPYMPISKSVYEGFKINTQITCEPFEQARGSVKLKISWALIEYKCWKEYVRISYTTQYEAIFVTPNQSEIKSHPIEEICTRGRLIILPELKLKEPAEKMSKWRRDAGMNELQSIFTITKDGLYIFVLAIQSESQENFIADVHVEMKSEQGYLSAVDWPLLPFYGAMFLAYVGLGIIWLTGSFLKWKDLLRIQYWIGVVILLGMLENAIFYGEYQMINMTGVSMRGMVLLAELLSCVKRALARTLVIIVSQGFGIFKPQLRPILHCAVGTGYLVLACVESFLRVMHTKNDQLLAASIPLAVLDTAICWWIITSLEQTTRTLKLQRNLVKLSQYRHFTNTCVFGVLASMVFMMYSIQLHRFTECLTDWKKLWADEAFWHLLFAAQLLVIITPFRADRKARSLDVSVISVEESPSLVAIK